MLLAPQCHHPFLQIKIEALFEQRYEQGKGTRDVRHHSARVAQRDVRIRFSKVITRHFSETGHPVIKVTMTIAFLGKVRSLMNDQSP